MKRHFGLAYLLLLPLWAIAADTTKIPLLAIESAYMSANETAFIAALHQRGSIRIANNVCVMAANTSMQQNLQALEKAYPANSAYLYISDFDLMEAMVARGDADFTVIDGDRDFSALNQYDNLTIGWPISAPKLGGSPHQT
jgi:hypothetical protein